MDLSEFCVHLHALYLTDVAAILMILMYPMHILTIQRLNLSIRSEWTLFCFYILAVKYIRFRLMTFKGDFKTMKSICICFV